MNANHKIKARYMCLVAGALIAFSGCGGAYDSTARGIVTLDGRTVPRGLVSFHPMAGGPAVCGSISADGSYSVYTGREEGLPSGEYIVSITSYEAPVAAETAKSGPPPPGKTITPSWYRMKESSGLQYAVKPGQNEINLELKSQPPAGWKPTRSS